MNTYILDLECDSIDLQGKICALNHRLEYKEISKKEYDELIAPLQKKLTEINKILESKEVNTNLIEINLNVKKLSRIRLLRSFIIFLSKRKKISFHKWYVIQDKLCLKSEILYSNNEVLSRIPKVV